MKNETVIFYAMVSLAALTLIVSIITFNVYLIALVAILELSSVAIFRLWYILDSFIFKHTNLIEIFSGYELSGDRFSAIRRIENKISATTAASLIIDHHNEIEKKKIENIITHINYPFKFSMQVERLNMGKILDKLQTRRNIREIELSRLQSAPSKSSVRINQIKREIEQIEHDIASVSTGDTPLRIAYYIFTSAASESLYDAEERAKSQIRELTSQFDAILNSKSQVVIGHELLELLEADSTMVIK